MTVSDSVMEDDATSTATMTSVTDEFSVEESDLTGNDLETSSQVTASDTNEEGNTTVVHMPQLQTPGERDDSNNAADVSMDEEGSERGEDTMGPAASREQNSNAQRGGKERSQGCQDPSAGSSGAGKPSGKGVPFPNLLSAPGNWYEHRCFDHYWRHYQFVSMWCQKHVQVYRAVVQRYSKEVQQQEAARRAQKPHSQPDAHVFKKPTSSRTIRNRKARRRRKAAKKRMRMALKNAELAGSGSSFLHSSDEGQRAEGDKGGETTQSAVEGTEDEEEEQMEISEEMLDFFAHTYKHRQERGMIR